MKPRIVKKLSKKIVQMNHSTAKYAWLNNEFEGWGYQLYGEYKKTATAKQLRRHYYSKSTINNVWFIVRETYYWCEETDFYPVYEYACGYILWKYGVPAKAVDDWPVMKKRITGKLVVSLLRAEIKAPKGGL